MTASDRRSPRDGGHEVVTVPAEIDAGNADMVRASLLAGLSRAASLMIIDMSATTFCDSAGVQAVIDAYNQAAASHIRIRIVATEILRILALTGIDQLIPVYPSLKAALAEAPDPGQHKRPAE
jgi:anti-sigma B factor antagonist